MSDDALEELEDGKTALTSGNRPSLSRRQLIWIGIGLGTAYGLFARVMFGLEKTGAVFEIMSTSFIFGVPSALGYARFEGDVLFVEIVTADLHSENNKEALRAQFFRSCS